MKKLIGLLVVLGFITSCSPSPEVIQKALSGTQTAIVLLTPSPTNTPRLTSTPIPTSTPRLTSTPKPTSTPKAINAVAKNNVATQEQNGIVVTVSRIVIAQKGGFSMDFSSPIFDDKQTIVELVFSITNNSFDTVSMNFTFGSDGIVSVNGEQQKFEDYDLDYDNNFNEINNDTWFGDDLDSDILPGSTVTGGLWVGIKKSAWNEVNKIVIQTADAWTPDFSRKTKLFTFNIDVKDWTFEPLPDDL